MWKRYEKDRRKSYKLLEIDTAQIGTLIFGASDLVEDLHLDVRDMAKASVSHEYLVTDYIPPQAIRIAVEMSQGKNSQYCNPVQGET